MKDGDLEQIIYNIILSRSGKPQRERSLPSQNLAMQLLGKAQYVLEQDPILLKLTGQYVVVGDIHGNIDDLLRIFEKYGYPPSTKYLFLGDYVDRGDYSTEVLLLLYALKIKFKNQIYLLRGNHEADQIASMYGFRTECFKRLNKNCYNKVIETFKQMPIAAVLNHKIFCVHGGIPRKLNAVDDLMKIEKARNPPLRSITSDILWSDPEPKVDLFKPSSRGIGNLFGVKPLLKFLSSNNLEMVIRSHESCEKGFDYPFSRKQEGAKSCLTIFSTTNYCDEANQGAVALVSPEGEVTIEVFDAMTHREKQSRKMILPEWFLRHTKGKEPVTAEPELDVVKDL